MRQLVMATAVTVGLIGLAGCAAPSSSGVYQQSESGETTRVQFGTIVAARPIEVQGDASGFGGLAGGVLGGIGGSAIGGGVGQDLATAGGAILGSIIGQNIEREIRNREGVEYTIALQNGEVISVAQTLNSGDTVLPVDARVAVQSSGYYQRVLPADNVPTAMERPKGIEFY